MLPLVRLEGNLSFVSLGCQITWHMQISASFVVHSFHICWKCGLSGSIPKLWVLQLFFCEIKSFFVVLVDSYQDYFCLSCHFLWLRNDGMEDQYSVLIRFDNQNSADNFYKHFNGRRFSSLEVCFTSTIFLIFLYCRMINDWLPRKIHSFCVCMCCYWQCSLVIFHR